MRSTRFDVRSFQGLREENMGRAAGDHSHAQVVAFANSTMRAIRRRRDLAGGQDDLRANGAAILTELRGVAGLTKAEFVERARNKPGLEFVTVEHVSNWEAGLSCPDHRVMMVALEFAGRVGLVVLATMLPLA